MRTLLLLPGICAVVLAVCNRLQISQFSTVKWVSLTVLVVDGSSGRPIPGAEVQIIHEFDYERPPVKGRTDANGRVVLRNQFHGWVNHYILGRTEHVTFDPFVMRVTSAGFSEIRAPLTQPIAVPSRMATVPPLNLTYPVSEAVEIRLTPSNDAACRGKKAQQPEGCALIVIGL